MNIGLIDVDGKIPNLALMKLSTWHKSQGDDVAFFDPLYSFDKVYTSKTFTYSPDYRYLPADVIKGGWAYNAVSLPDEIEHIIPDYSLYDMDYSMGFLTRGCNRHCDHCIVPEKEGRIHEHADIEEFALHKDVVLLDNNVLQHSHGIRQIEKIVRLGLNVDFNQGLDARLIDDDIARLLSRVRWLEPLRLACDSPALKCDVAKAVGFLRAHGATPKNYSCYVLIGEDIAEAHDRVEFLRALEVDPFAQPYRDPDGTEPSREQKDFARWVNIKSVWKTVKWKDYRGRSRKLLQDAGRNAVNQLPLL